MKIKHIYENYQNLYNVIFINVFCILFCSLLYAKCRKKLKLKHCSDNQSPTGRRS